MATSAASAPAPDVSSARVAARPITPIFLRRIGRTLMRRIVSALEETKSSLTVVALAAVHAEVLAFRMTTSRRRGAARKRLSWHSRSSTVSVSQAGGICPSSGNDIDRFDLSFIAQAFGTKRITPTKRQVHTNNIDLPARVPSQPGLLRRSATALHTPSLALSAVAPRAGPGA
jgi:hypothetical protein